MAPSTPVRVVRSDGLLVSDVNPLPISFSDNADYIPTKDAGADWNTQLGVTGAAFASSNQSGSKAAVTDLPEVGKKLTVTDILISVNTLMTVNFYDEVTDKLLFRLYLAANGSAQITFRGNFTLPSANSRLMVQTSTSGSIAVTALYHSTAS